MRWDIINQLIKKNNYKSYLEIGYYKGWSFDNVHCESKIAIDPNPTKHSGQEVLPSGSIFEEDGGTIHKCDSDRFFELKDMVGNTEKFDLIFIDGSHLSEQVDKDLGNALRHLSPNGTIVMHDCNPPEYEHTTIGIDGCWTGDVYRSAIKFQLNDNHTEYDFFTVDTDWGVGIIQAGKGEERDIRKYIKSSMITWDYFDKNREKLLNLISKQDFIRMIKGVKPRNEKVTHNNSPAE